MTLVIRTTDSVTSPARGSKVLPVLANVSGVLSRFHADYFVGADNAATGDVWPDLVGEYHLRRVGAVALTEDTTTGGKRTVELIGTGTLQSLEFVTFPSAFTIGVRIQVTANPSSHKGIFYTTTAGGGLLGMSWGGYGAFGSTGAAYPSGAAVAKPAWVTVVGVFDQAGGNGKIVTNGTTVSSTQDWTGMPTNRFYRMSGDGYAAGLRVRQVVVLDHAADADETTALTSALTTD